MNREKKLLKNTLILAIGTFFPKMAIFLTLPILTGYLNKTDYGIYDLAVTMVALILPAATLQVQSAAFRFLIDVQEKNDEIKKIISDIYIFVLLTSIVALVITFFLLRKMPFLVSLGLCLYYFFDIVDNVNRQIIRGLSKNVDYSISAVISGLGQIVFTIILVSGLRGGLVGSIYSLVLAEFSSAMYLYVKGNLYRYISLREFDKNKLKEILAYSWPMVPNSLSQWVIHSSDRLVITVFMGVQANAVYSVAYKIPSILSLAQTTFNMAWQENATITVGESDSTNYYAVMFRWLFNIVSGMMAILIGCTPVMFMLFVRGDYAEAYNLIPLLFMGMFFLCLSTFWGGIFVAIKKTREVGITTVIAAAVNLVLDFLLINRIGMYAGAVSSVVAYLLMCILRAKTIGRYMKINYDLMHILRVLLVLVFQCALCFMRNKILDVVNIVLGVIVFVFLNRDILRVLYKKVFNKVK